MRKVELKLEPPKVQITDEEILADLRYPAPAGQSPAAASGASR